MVDRFGMRRVARDCFLLFALLGLPVVAFAQSATLSVGSGSGTVGGTVSLPINLTSAGGAQPAGLEWTFSYTSDITGVTVVTGSTAAAVNKSVACNGNLCLVFGTNDNTIAGGIVATATFQIASNPSTSSIPIQITGVIASTAGGSSIPASGVGGSISVPQTLSAAVSSVSGVSCSSLTINTPGSTSCSVTLNSAAPSGGFAVPLSSNNVSLTVPSSVTITAGQSSAGFTATATQVSSSQIAVVMAGTDGTAVTVTLNPPAPAQLTSILCTPSTLGSNASSACRVSLNNPATSAVIVTISSSAAVLTVPSNVTIAAGQTSAGFSASTGTLSNSQTVSVTAALDGQQQAAAINLTAAIVPSLLTCSPATVTTPGSASCTITLTAPAPAGGATIALSSDNASVNVPATLSILAGQTSGSFTATMASVASSQTVQITASYNGGTQSFALNASSSVSAPLSVGSLICAPSILAANASATCTLSLGQAAGAAMTVALSQNSSYLNIPSQVAIAPGQASATFMAANVSTGVSGVTVDVMASLNGQSQAAQITLGGPPQSLIGSMPHVLAEGGWNTTFTLVNKSSATTGTNVNLFDDSGNPLALPIALPQQASASPLVAAAMGQTLGANASFILQASGAATVPYVEGSAQVFGSGPVDGFAIFHFGPSAQEAVVPLETRDAASYLLAFDNTNNILTGIAIENISAQNANVAVVLRDGTGTEIGTETIPLNSDGHTSFILSTQFPATAGIRGTVEIDTPGFGSATPGQISVLGIRYTPPGTLTTIPALANVGTLGGSMAQVASGGGWETTFALVNTGTSAAQASLLFFDDNGNPLSLPFPQTGGTWTTSAFTQSIAPGASLWLQTAEAPTDPLFLGSAQLLTTGNVSGYAIFRYTPNGQEAVVPLESRNASVYLLAFDNTNGTATGVAISTVSTQAISVPVIVRDDTGAQITTGSIALAANGQSSFVLTNQFAATANIRGTVEFDTPPGAQISILGIRTPPAMTFTTLPPLAP